MFWNVGVINCFSKFSFFFFFFFQLSIQPYSIEFAEIRYAEGARSKNSSTASTAKIKGKLGS